MTNDFNKKLVNIFEYFQSVKNSRVHVSIYEETYISQECLLAISDAWHIQASSYFPRVAVDWEIAQYYVET